MARLCGTNAQYEMVLSEHRCDELDHWRLDVAAATPPIINSLRGTCDMSWLAKRSMATTVFGAALLMSTGLAHAAAATHLLLTVPSPTVSYTNVGINIQALDAANQVDTTYNHSITLTSSDPAFVGSGTPYTLVNGDVTFNGSSFKTAGMQSVTATDTVNAGISGTTTVTVVPGATVGTAVSGALNAVAGVPFSISVHSRDNFGNVTSDYSGTVHLTSDDPQAVLPADMTVVNGTSGSAMATLKTPGEFTITATDTVNASMTGSGLFEVVPGPAASFQLSLPASADPGVNFAFDVQAYDAVANPTSDYSGTVHLSSSDANAELSPDGTLTNGFGTFYALLQAPNTTTTLTATDTVNSAITGTAAASTTPVTLQRFDIE
jgi:hypothetical protein